MFNKLYKLYGKRNNERTPLEDFNTECFAGVLRMSPAILKSFVEFLKLPVGKYSVTTQAYYSLSVKTSCYIDMVLESDTTICFIENKVNSEEGQQQLLRYSQVLKKFYNNHELEYKKSTRLRYCTKNVEIKPLIDPEFFQFRWFQVGQLIADKHEKDVLGINYLKFLQHHKMALDPSISTDTVVSLKNYFNTYDTMKYHLDESAKNFQNTFPKAHLADRNKSKIQNELIRHKRFSNSIENPLKDKSDHTEILYSIDFEDVRLQTQIWIRAGHGQIKAIKEAATESGLFEFVESTDWGLGLRNRIPLYSFIDSPNSDDEIKNWFKESFEKVRAFIDQTPELGWSDSVGLAITK